MVSRMGLFGRSKVSAGLDIGSGYVKLVVMDHSSGEPEITNVVATPLLLDAIVDGEVMDPVLVAETIRGVAESAGLKKAKLVASVGGHDVIIKKIQMDRANEADARELMRWEAEQHVPFDMEGVQLDFQILDPEGTDPQMSVLLVAAKREVVENRVGLLGDAGLTPAVMDVDSFALHNAFERNYPNALNGLVALAHLGNETTHVLLLQDGVPIMVRDIPFGARRLREALQRELGLSAEEADEIIQGRASAVGLESFVEERVEELALGIERAIAFLTAQSSGLELGRLFLSGGCARVPGLVEALAGRLSVRTEIANPLERVAVRPEVMERVNIDDIAPMLMLSVGLALRQAN
jgi:type IV pilus assembly protein PilM